MGKIISILFFIALVSVGGLYLYWQYQNASKITIDNEKAQIVENADNVKMQESESDWKKYVFANSRIYFETKYPVKWDILEQNTESDFITLVFTNKQDCQLLLNFDLKAEKYNFDLVNNEKKDDCAKTLSQILAYATIPDFSLGDLNNKEVLKTADKEIENKENEESSNEKTEIVEQNLEESKEERKIEENDQTTENIEENTNESEGTNENVIENNEDNNLNAEIDNNDSLTTMSVKERYESAKSVLKEFLNEYAYRHWDKIRSMLTKEAQAKIVNLSDDEVFTKFYYYEILTVLEEKDVGHFQVKVKLTDKDENPIGSGDGIYTLDLYWQDGKWKINQYAFN